ncbi:MAG: hypothetical protein SA339_10970 [Methanomassiliicoccus sp.]|nr:hypothetical protein [Methanomassiliicoccus sp.]
MRIKRCEIFDHIKSYEGKTDMSGFLAFIDSPIRELRVIKIPNDRIRLKYIDQHNNIQRVDVGADEQEEIEFP